MTDTDTRPATTSDRSPTVRTGRHLLAVQLYLGMWLWAILAVVAVVLTVILDRTTGIEVSTWETLDRSPRWFLFAMSVLVVAAYFTAHVANGMTRRSFGAAAAVVMVVTAVLYALVAAAGYLVERAVFTARGWPTALREDHLFTSTDQVAAVVAESTIVLLAYAASGLLVGAVYYRTGALWGTVALPLTVGPVLLAEGLLRSGWADTVLESLTGGARPPAATGAVLCLALAVAMGAAAHAVLRDAPLHSPSS